MNTNLLRIGVSIAAVGLMAGCGAASSSAPTSKTAVQPVSTTTTQSPVTATVATMLGPDLQSGGSSVPWSLVGPGWILATASVSGNSNLSVYLIDPQGGRYLIGPVPPNTSLDDWSGDGQRALFVPSYEQEEASVTPGASSTTTAVDVMELRTGSTSNFSLPTVADPAGPSVDEPSVQFTHPDGTALLVGTTSTFDRYSPAGSVQQSYPTGDYQESPDGALLASNTKTGIQIITNAGQPVTSFALPAGMTACSVAAWWDAKDLLVSCDQGYWLQPSSGGAPTELISKPPITPGVGVEGPLWELPSGYYTQGFNVACSGSEWLIKLNRDGTTTRLQPPGIASGSNVIGLGTYAGRLAIMGTPTCGMIYPGAPTVTEVAWYDPVADTVTPLLGGCPCDSATPGVKTDPYNVINAILFGNS